MKKINILIIILIAVAAGFFFWAWNQSNNQPTPTSGGNNLTSNTAASSSAFSPIDNSFGWAEVEVLPLSLTSSEWSFGVALNAHQEIGADLTKAAILTDDRGDTLAPLRWEDPNPGEHHRKGILVFAAPSSTPKNITITMTNVGEAATRKFSWSLP